MKKIKKRKATIIKKNKTINTKPQNKKRNKIQNNSKKITLTKQTQKIPAELPLGNDTIVPLRAGETIAWSLL